MRDYIIDGVPLRDPSGKWGIDYTRSITATEISRRFQSENVYGSHGATEGAPVAYFTQGVEVVVVNIVGDDKDDFNEMLYGLQALMARPVLTVLTAPQRSALSGSARYGMTFHGSVTAQTSRMRSMGSTAVERISEKAARATFILENIDGFRSSVDDYNLGATALSGSPQTISLNSMAGNSNAPIVDGIFRIKGPISNGGHVKISDAQSTWRSLRLDVPVGSLGAGDYFLIDMKTFAARLVTSAVWDLTAGTDEAGNLSVGIDGAMSIDPGDPQSGFPSSGFEYGIVVEFSAATGTIEFQGKRSYLS